MSDRERFCRALKLIVWGCVLIYLDFNLGTLDILPDWLGYMLILKALPIVGESEKSADLLKPLGIFLAVWEGILWIVNTFGISIGGIVGIGFNSIGYITTVIVMYFNFQLFTDIANAADSFGCSKSGRILHLRTVNTVLVTILGLPLPWKKIEVGAYILLIVLIAVTVWICAVLFAVRKELECEPDTE